MATTPLHLSFLLLCLSFLMKSQAKHVPALYIFGDSIMDSGNNNERETLAKADYPPYGIDYVIGTTGRFTNGFTLADYFSESLKLQLLPPFLDRTNIIKPSSAGYNFASASAGILPETGATAGKNLNLRMQVGFFRRIVSTIMKSRFKTPGRLSRHLSRSIFLVAIGCNDYAVNYLVPQFYNSSRMYNPEQFAQLLVNELGNHLQEMYRLGGRKFVVFDVGPIGCLPAIARKRAGPKTLCVEEINNVVSIFNAKLALKINQLSSTLRNSTFVLVKNFNFVHDLVENPSRFGFKDSRNPCCIVSEESGACIPDKIPCKDRDGHVFWDAAHPSSAANRIIANEIFNGTSLCTPMNVRKLINAHKL